MMNVTRKALRSTLAVDWPLRRSANRELRPFGGFFTQQPSRFEDQDDDEQGEDDRLGPTRVDQRVRNRGDQTNEHSAQEGALDVADAAHDRRGKAVQTIAEALKEPGRVV